MGHSLGMKVTAEGVSCERNRQSLRNLECDFAQGFLIGHPLGASDTADEITARFTEPSRRRRVTR